MIQSPLTILWHNSSMGKDEYWKGWEDVYAFILKK
jgi:hypothetical protein